MLKIVAAAVGILVALSASPVYGHNGFRSDSRNAGIAKFMDIGKIRHEHRAGAGRVKLVIRFRGGWTLRQMAQYADGPSWSPRFAFSIGTSAGVGIYVNKRGKLKGSWWDYGDGDYEFGRMSPRDMGKPNKRELAIMIRPTEWHLSNLGPNGSGIRWKASTGLHEVTYDRTRWLRHRDG